LKIALISDIHGNLEALEVVTKAINQIGVDRIICLGDVVGYGANPVECLELVKSIADVIILGNHDAAVIERESLELFNDYAIEAILWTRSKLSSDHLSDLASLPMYTIEDRLHFVHGTPCNPQRWNYIFTTEDASHQFNHVLGDICFVGHSHVPGDYRDSKSEKRSNTPEITSNPAKLKRIINVGSIGQPRDRDPRLGFVIFDDQTDQVEFVRLTYDIDTAASKIRQAGLPEFLADRLFWGW